MKTKQNLSKTACIFILAVILSARLIGQSEERNANYIGAKILIIDYGNPNSIDSLKISNGLELVYTRNILPFLNISIPFKVGMMNVAEDINNRNFASFDALLQLQYAKENSWFFPYLLAGGSVVWEESRGSQFQIPLGAGSNFRVGSNSFINLQGEYRQTSEKNRKNLQVGIGYIYRLGAGRPDSDRDGVPDDEDACPATPGSPLASGCPDSDADGVADQDDQCPQTPGTVRGCPDTDKDGVPDPDDKCPNEAGVLSGCPDQDNDGIIDREDQCPQEAGPAALNGCPDKDNDGIADRFDECPDQAGPSSNRGCPLQDSDQDGIADDMDLCPQEAGPAVTRGCPDRDNDGVADKDDRCPDAAGPYAGCPDTDGDGLVDIDDKCPDQPGLLANKGCPEIEEKAKEVLNFAMQAVQFETGMSILKAESYPILDQIAEIMIRYPAYSLKISGHTDNVGDEGSNQVLSQERARACYQYLVSKGTSPARLSFFGFGESRPIADNRTLQGRKLNRRVEFELFIP